MELTQEMLLRAVPNLNKRKLDEFVASFNMYAIHCDVDTPRRAAHYLAQVFNESGALTATSENMNYSAQRLMQIWPGRFKTLAVAKQYAHNPMKLANNVYANRMGNGNEKSGDGWRYRGRGYIGLTGKQNYAEFNKFDLCTEDVLMNPDLVADYPLNQVSALWFWEKYKLSDIADTDNGANADKIVEQITRKVNGGLIGLDTRKMYYHKFAKMLGL